MDRFVRADYIQHNPLAPDGAEALKNLAVGMHQQFPDAKYDIERVLSGNRAQRAAWWVRRWSG
ncbi:hypothetical protein ACIBVL_25330 [Streptomyces sp. NPDC049687]|uniref:hypothetical protein n=1 Tax=Streptomyces sp. NPDC049687 TaxID=3365596 RepID=UPI00378FFA50